MRRGDDYISMSVKQHLPTMQQPNGVLVSVGENR